MTERNELRTVLTLLTILALAGSMGVTLAQSVAPSDSAGQPAGQSAVRQAAMLPALGNLPLVRMSSRQASPLGDGIVQNGRLVHMTAPVYPPAAVRARISGVVSIEARIGKDGRVVETSVVSGPYALRRVAEYAIKRWQYEPTILNGKPVERVAVVDLSFVLGRS